MVRHLHKTYRRWRGPTHQTQKLLQSLLSLYQLLRTPQSPNTLLQAILDAAVECVPGAQRGSLVVREGAYFRYRALHGYDFEKLQNVRFPIDQILQLLPAGQRGTQVLSYDEWNAEFLDPESHRLLQMYGDIQLIRRSMVSSIFVSGNFFGTLVLDNLESYDAFPPAAEATAMLLAEQAGAVIEHAQLLEDLRRTHSQLAENEKLASLGRLVAGVAHEINNPLTAVIGYTELLQLEALSDDAVDALFHIRSGANRMREVVRNLQMFARQQRHGQGEVDILLLINQVLALKQSELAIDQIAVERNLPVDLPNIWGDGGALSQVLLNLVNNAQYALRSQPQQRHLLVQAQHRPEANCVQVVISDNGPGMPAHVLSRIFDPFFTTKPQGHGSGLGLSVCYGIVGEHGGRIWAESMEGQGASLFVELPLPQHLANAKCPATQQRPAGKRVLVIDDDELVQRLVYDALRPENAVTIVQNGYDGLELLRQQPFDIVLCDLKMPGMRGNEFYAELQAVAPNYIERLIFISGDTSNIASFDFLGEVGRPLLAKPFTPNELYFALQVLNKT